MDKWETSTCRSCGAPVIWALTEAGKRIPVDPEPMAGGNIVLSDKPFRPRPDGVGPAVYIPRAHILSQAEGMTRRPAPEARQSHFATCPDAEAWRQS